MALSRRSSWKHSGCHVELERLPLCWLDSQHPAPPCLSRQPPWNLLDREKKKGEKNVNIPWNTHWKTVTSWKKFRHLSQRWRSLTKIQTGQSGLQFAAGWVKEKSCCYCWRAHQNAAFSISKQTVVSCQGSLGAWGENGWGESTLLDVFIPSPQRRFNLFWSSPLALEFDLSINLSINLSVSPYISRRWKWICYNSKSWKRLIICWSTETFTDRPKNVPLISLSSWS